MREVEGLLEGQAASASDANLHAHTTHPASDICIWYSLRGSLSHRSPLLGCIAGASSQARRLSSTDPQPFASPQHPLTLQAFSLAIELDTHWV